MLMYSMVFSLFRHEGDVVFFRVLFGIAPRRGVDGEIEARSESSFSHLLQAGRKSEAFKLYAVHECTIPDGFQSIRQNDGYRRAAVKRIGSDFYHSIGNLYLIFLGAVGIGATTFFVNAAITLIPVGVVTMIQFMYPTVVTVAMATIFREKLTKKKIGTVLLAIAGLVLVSDISGGSVDKRGILLALCASFTYAFYIISNERSCISGLPLPVKLTYAGLGCSVVFGIVACSGAGMGFPNTQMSCIIMLVTCLGNMAAYYLIALGISRIGALRASLIDMMEPVFSVLFSFLVYHDKITLTMLGGIAMILISVMIASRSDVET